MPRIDTAGFSPLPELRSPTFEVSRRFDTPVVHRGAASHWRGVRHWSFGWLADHVPDVPITLVSGNREAEATRFEASSLRRYLHALERPSRRPPGYLKEFDLLAAQPELAIDLPHETLIPPSHRRSIFCWIGPADTSTGLHFDRIDNVAVQVLGRKRWRFVRPGVVERCGAVSAKYDTWAVLASRSAVDLVREGTPSDFFWVDLEPGDVLTIPRGWWHEVTNLEPTLFVGGFHGPVLPVIARGTWLGLRHQFHRLGWLGRGNCACHPAGDAPTNIANKEKRP